MRSCLLIIGCLLCSFILQAQYNLMYTVDNNGKILALPTYSNKSLALKIPEVTYHSYTPLTVTKNKLNVEEFMPDFQPVAADRPMNMQVLSAAYRPFFNIYAPMLRRTSPMAFDFVEASIVPLNDNFTFVTVGSQQTWPGLGGITTINPMLAWKEERWTVTGGAFASRYATPFNPHAMFMGGVNLQVQYEVTDWMAAKAWGQYAFYDGKEEKNPHLLMNPFYPHTSVGGALEFKINENVGVGVGVNYEFNPWRRKMEAQRMIYPIFRSGKFKIGGW